MKLTIDGRRQTWYGDARRLIIVDGQEVWLQQAMYLILLRLAEHQQNGCDWVPHSVWHECYRPLLTRYIYLLRAQIGSSGLRIRNNAGIGYRIDLDSKDITVRRRADYAALLADVYDAA